MAVDVVVVGSGAAGLSAALFASIAGLRAVVVERTDRIGGTSALSAATTWIPGATHGAGSGDTIETAAHFLDQVVGNASSAAMRRAFLDAGPAAIATLEANTDVQFRAYAMHPDYEQEFEGATLRGRALEPLPFDGRLLGRDLALLRPPIREFTLFGGMMVDRTDIGHLLKLTKSARSFRHAARLLARYGIDRMRHDRGTRLVMGNALIGRMLLSARKRGVEIVTGAEVTDFVRDPSGAVLGVVVSQGAQSRRIEAGRGVVLASGGFNRNPAYRERYLHQPVPELSPAAPGHTGLMHQLAIALGARHGDGERDAAFWAPVSTRVRADGSIAVFPHFVLDRGKPGTICVNAAGRRFVNESVSYHEFARAMFATNETVPAIPAYLIADSAALRKYGLGMVRPGGRGLAPFLADGYLTQAATVRDLAQRLGIDEDGLEQSVADMNAFAETGLDPQFGRGTTAYHRVNGDASHGPNPNLGPLRTAPFYAVKLTPGDIGAAKGLVTDESACVLGADDRPIAGLYACGNDMQSVMGGAYPGPGITIGPAIAFAYLAARHMATREWSGNAA